MRSINCWIICFNLFPYRLFFKKKNWNILKIIKCCQMQTWFGILRVTNSLLNIQCFISNDLFSMDSCRFWINKWCTIKRLLFQVFSFWMDQALLINVCIFFWVAKLLYFVLFVQRVNYFGNKRPKIIKFIINKINMIDSQTNIWINLKLIWNLINF